MNDTKSSQTYLLIYKLREKFNLSLQDLADALGVTKVSVWNWENGKPIKAESLYKLARFFGITVDELVNGKLNNESTLDYLTNTFAIDRFDFGNEISDDNYLLAQKYYTHVQLIKIEFWKLINFIAASDLNDIQFEEFQYLLNDFDFDYAYYQYLLKELNLEQESFFTLDKSEFVKKIINAIKTIKKYFPNQDEFDWEMNKLFQLKAHVLKFDPLLNYGDVGLFKIVCDALQQRKKDELLSLLVMNPNKDIRVFNYSALKDEDFNAIENDEYIKILLKSGAKVLSLDIWQGAIPCIDEETFDYYDGTKHEYKKEVPNHEQSKNLEEFYLNVNFESWKKQTLKDYDAHINYPKTKLVASIVNDKNKNPLKYLEVLQSYYENPNN